MHLGLWLLHRVVVEEEKLSKKLRRKRIRQHVQHHKGRYTHCKCSTVPEIPQKSPSQLDQVMASEPEYLFEP